ncbi:protein disulfide-isomerase A6 homolog [Ctenocephalides felis]|uniref:protein disulfide-isomerase A6 homolog n=1 Tax=Ctenocephalides felis TaxID=7515 RepID=UPI000E6E1046|nr:protein disulfide-isomerase A6 homolog [Ctenocephalides felis]
MIGASKALYHSNSDIVNLTPDNFDELVLKKNDVWLVEFFAPWCGHCKTLVPEYTKAATALQGIVQVGAINADEHKSLAKKYNVRSFPTIKIFGIDKKSPENYKGPRTAPEIIESAMYAATKHAMGKLGVKSGSKDNSGDVIDLNDSSFDKLVIKSDDVWLVQFYAPWSADCKKLAPNWAKAATMLKDKVKFGVIDATVHTNITSQYKVQSYPTIKFFAPGKKHPYSVSEYDDGITTHDIVTWVHDKFSEMIPAPEIVELINEEVASKTCLKTPLCIVSILPHIYDCNAACRNKYITLLKTMGEKFKQKMWGWLWTRAGAQPTVEEVLEIKGYPAMAVVNLTTKKYALLTNRFSQNEINEFLNDFSHGRVQPAPIKKVRGHLIHSVKPWDGKDGSLPEDDIDDLFDILINEKDEL